MIPQLLPIYRNLRYRTLLSDSWTPADLFASSEVGVWYDPSDLSTMFQNSDGTTAVAVGDHVGYIADKSGNGFHATQAAAASRPVLRQTAGGLYYLEFDGIDDSLVTPSIDFSATDKMSVFAGLHKTSDVAAGVFCELSVDVGTNNGAFLIRAPYAPSQTGYTVNVRADTGSVYYLNTGIAAPSTNTVGAIIDFAGATLDTELKPYINGVLTQNSGSGGVAGSGNFGSYPLYICSRAGISSPFNGHLYSLIVRGALSDEAQIASAETYVNSKTGAY